MGVRPERQGFPVVVHVMLLRGEHLFLLRRAATGFMDGYFCLPGGHQKAGESVSDAARRECLEEAGVDYALLECTNLYPSPPETVSLKGVTELRKAFPNAIVGFSDHSVGSEMALASVALGACILERHFTDSRYREGPDIACSMDSAELRHLIDRSREIHVALHNEKRRSAPEEAVYRFARTSVVADRDLSEGHVIAEADIWGRRPGSGEIAGHEFDQVVGRRLRHAVTRNSQLKWSDLD